MTTRREFQDQLAAAVAQFRRAIEAGVSGFSPDEAASQARVARARGDFRFFAETYFPHYLTHQPSILHEHLFDRLPSIVDATRGAREAIAAPRGSAKSTLASQIFSLWCALTGRKRFVVVIMDAYEQAATMLEAIKAELEVNPRLAMDFPAACGEGRLWREGVFVARHEVKFQAFGSGKRMRGVRHGPWRPDLILCDDLENDESVRSPEQRDKLERWFRRTVLSLGPSDGSADVIVLGTILHHDSLLARLRRDRLWHGQTFRAVLAWPDDMALWDQWEAVLLNEGEAAARSWYERRKARMERGARVLWPSVQPLYALMVKRAQDGHDAFDSEQQNDPSAGDAAPLAHAIQLHADTPADGWLWFGAVDPSLGRAGASRDPSAIVVGAWSRAENVLRVYAAPIRRRVPGKIIAEVIALQRQWRCLAWAVEAVQFQEFFRQVLIEESLKAGVPVPAFPVTPKADKVLRIEALEPFLAAGRIRIHKECATLIEQLKHFPHGDHDDGPDALEMLWQLASRHAQPMEFMALGDADRDLWGRSAARRFD